MMNVNKAIEEQLCQPAGNAIGVNISIQADRQLVAHGTPTAGMEQTLKILLTGWTIAQARADIKHLDRPK